MRASKQRVDLTELSHTSNMGVFKMKSFETSKKVINGSPSFADNDWTDGYM